MVCPPPSFFLVALRMGSAAGRMAAPAPLRAAEPARQHPPRVRWGGTDFREFDCRINILMVSVGLVSFSWPRAANSIQCTMMDHCHSGQLYSYLPCLPALAASGVAGHSACAGRCTRT
jgi:hypothetical protein